MTDLESMSVKELKDMAKEKGKSGYAHANKTRLLELLGVKVNGPIKRAKKSPEKSPEKSAEKPAKKPAKKPTEKPAEKPAKSSRSKKGSESTVSVTITTEQLASIISQTSDSKLARVIASCPELQKLASRSPKRTKSKEKAEKPKKAEKAEKAEKNKGPTVVQLKEMCKNNGNISGYSHANKETLLGLLRERGVRI